MITRGLPFADYLARTSVHFSTLRAIEVSPLHYRRAVDVGREDTDAMRIGRAVHALTLTPAVDDVAVWDGASRRGKAWEAFRDEYANKTILTSAEWERAAAMRRAVLRHSHAGALLSGYGSAEVTIEWTDPATGLACRCRVDWLRTDGGLVEVKTARASHPRAFASSVARLGYHAQLAFYADGYEHVTGHAPPSVHIIAVEKEPPHDVCVYRVGQEVLDVGRRKIDGWLRAVAECTRTGTWPGAGGESVVELVLPDWAAADGLEDVDVSGEGIADGTEG